MSIQSSILEHILQIYSDAVLKKVDRDNHLDIHLPHIHPQKGTHLFFNTSRGKIKVGFYCRDDEFVSSVLAKSDLLEKYSQGVRLKDNPQFEQVEDAVKAAVSLIDAMTGKGDKEHSSEAKQAEIQDTEPELDTKPDSDMEEDNRGFPMISHRKPPEDKKEAVQAYFQKWQKPSTYYAWRMGITAFIPEFVEELVSDDICPVFTEKQIRSIYSRIKNVKEIPILSYAPSELFHYTKQVWWIVPFCIWKEDVASMVFVDKNGFHALYDNEGELQILMIFPWDKLDDLDFEYGVDDDPNICRLTLYQENGGYLTFDEFISEGKDGDHGSYLRVIEAIWEARRKTIETSRGQSVWFEGAGGESFEVYEHPSNLYKGDDEKIADTITQLKTIVEFYTETLVLKSESPNMLEYVEASRREDRGTTCVFEVIKPDQIVVYFRTTHEMYIKNAQNEGFLSENFEWKDELLKLKGEPAFRDAFTAVQTLYDKANFLYMNGNVKEVDSSKVYYFGLMYYGNHPKGDPEYSALASSIASAKDLILFRGDEAKIYIDVIKSIHEDATVLLDNVLDFIRKEIEFRNQYRINGISLSELNRALTEEVEQGNIDLALYAKTHLYFDARYKQVASIQDFDGLKNFLESAKQGVDDRFVYAGLNEELQTDEAVMEYMLSNSRNVFAFFPEEIKKDKAFILNWITKTRERLQKAEEQKAADPENEDLVNAYEAANKAAGFAPHILVDMDDSLINDEEILAAALSCKYVSFIENLNPEKWGMDKEWAVKAAKMKIHSVHYLPDSLKNDPEVCKALLDVNLSAFNFFDEKMKHNKEVQEYALSKDGYVFQIFPEELKKDKAYIKQMLQECPVDQGDQRGFMVASAVAPLNSDMDLIKLAVQRNIGVFQKFYPQDRYSKDLFKYFLQVTPRVYTLVPQNLKKDRDLFLSLLSGEFEPSMREKIFRKSDWYNDLDFAVDLMQQSSNPVSYTYLKDEFKKNSRLLELLHTAASKEWFNPDRTFDVEKSLKYADLLIENDRNNSRSYLLKARLIDKFGLGNPEMLENAKKALELDPTSIPALLFIGSKSKDMNEAITYLKEALQLEPNNRSAHYHLGKKQLLNERYGEASEHLNRALILKEDDSTRALIGRCLLKQKKYKGAIGILEKVTADNPYMDDALFDLSQAHFDFALGHTKEAIAAVKQAIKSFEKPEYHRFLGHIYNQNSEHQNNATAHLQLVHFLEHTQGNKEKQLEYMKEADGSGGFNKCLFLSVFQNISGYSQLIEYVIDKGSYPSKVHLAKNPFLKKDYLDKLIKEESFTVLEAAVANKQIDGDYLEDVISKDDNSYRYSFALLGVLSNPNCTDSQIKKLLNHKYNWVRKRAAANLKHKIDYAKIEDRYILSGLMANENYTVEEKSEIAQMAEAAPVKTLTYKLPADFVGIEGYNCATEEENEDLREEVIEAIWDPEIESWHDMIQDYLHRYGESEYGVKSLAEEVIIKEPDETEFRERFNLGSIVSFTPGEPVNEPSVSKKIKLGTLVHEAISEEKGSWDYEEFKLEWEFRPEFLTPVLCDYERNVVGYYFDNASEEIEIEGESVESRTSGLDINLYILNKKGFECLDFGVVREEIISNHGDLSIDSVEQYMKELTNT